MPAFHGLDQYQPALVLFLGVATFAGVLGIGLRTLDILKVCLPGPWREVSAALLGTAMLSLTVQILAMFALATRSALIASWGVFVLLGSADLFSRSRRRAVPSIALHGPGVRILLALLAVAVAINVLLAMAPLTKIDEIFYQVLPPARIALDGELVFHLQPWLASALPQMGYPIAGTPLHALGFVDATNVWSWCLGALLAWFVARLVHEETRSPFMALLAAASVQVGLYPSIYHTTGGPHALGDLATTVAVLGLAFRESLLRSCSPAAYVALVSISALMAAFTKVSLLPVAGIVLALALWHAHRAGVGSSHRIAAAALLPWLVFYVPLCVWTFVQSGSPFGAMMADVFAPSVFDGAVRTEMAGTRQVNQRGLLFAIQGYVVHYPLLFPTALLALLALPTGARARRTVVASLFLLQVSIIAILLPHQSRFLSGLHHAALAVGLIQLHPYVERSLMRGLVRAAAAVVLLVPWLGAQAYRAWPLAPIALGFGEREAYFRNYIALYDDFRELDRILPADAVLYARNQLPSIYFPRPVYMHHHDLPAGRPAFALVGTSDRPLGEWDCAYMRLPSDCRFGDAVYTNLRAQYIVFRTPGEKPLEGHVEVREIVPDTPTVTTRRETTRGSRRGS